MLPGVKVGPLDPESTSEFGHVGKGNNARRLIRLHAAAHPAEFQRAHGKPVNEPRTKALRLDEVREAVDTADGYQIVGATVRGREDDPEKVVAYTVEGPPPARRTHKWFAQLADLDLPESNELGDRLAVIAEHREMGLLTGASDPVVKGDAHERSLHRQLADLKAKNDELARKLHAAQTAAPAGDADGDEGEDFRTEDDLADDAPWAGYDDENADQIVEKLRDSDQATRDAVLEYEQAGKDRKSVVAAANRTDLNEG